MTILDEAKGLQEIIVKHRRYFHENAEIGFELPMTVAYVKEKLIAMGYSPIELGNGVVACAGGKKPGKTFLIRGDMDALPIVEESDLEFKSTTKNMHACGHDFHASMLLGAAQLLKNHEDEIEGTVKLMFQPGEETLMGSKAMVDAGVLENPKVDAGVMIHVMPGTPMTTGMVRLPGGGIGLAAADWFTIRVQGKGAHGAMPQNGVDPLTVITQIHGALQAIHAREISANDGLVLTIGQIHGGNTSNVIPDTAYMTGTIRTINEDLRKFVKGRMVEITENVAKALRATATCEFEVECPSMKNDPELSKQVSDIVADFLGEDKVVRAEKSTPSLGGSEDFAHVANAIPAAMFALAAGSTTDGYNFSVHHPKVTFDENALSTGAAVYAVCAMEWLKKYK